MPGLKPVPPPRPNPVRPDEREGLRARLETLLRDLPEGAPVPAERVRRIAGNLIEREMVSGDEVTEARVAIAKLRSTPAGGPPVAAFLKELADRRAMQIADSDPPWILGNPAADLKRSQLGPGLEQASGGPPVDAAAGRHG